MAMPTTATRLMPTTVFGLDLNSVQFIPYVYAHFTKEILSVPYG
nr:MAG TPA: hypothetical protein [Caudoviricetes sp.]